MGQLGPPPINKTLVHVNNFIIATTQALTEFTTTCTIKLNEVSHKLDNAEVLLQLLEAKLETVDVSDPAGEPHTDAGQTDGGQTPQTQRLDSTGSQSPRTVVNDDSIPRTEDSNHNQTLTPQGDGREEPEADQGFEEDVQRQDQPAELDPAYAKYAKMIKMGVPKPSVVHKMTIDGLDPAMIEQM